MPPVVKLQQSVYTAAVYRMRQTFDDFENVIVTFSGGKDSTVMLHIAADTAREKHRRFSILLVDLEGQYDLTVQHAVATVDQYRDCADIFWICLPLRLRNAVSIYQTHWICWDPAASANWIRQPPEGAITDPATFPFYRHAMEFEEFVFEFAKWASRGTLTAVCIAIRADESLNRYRTIMSDQKVMFERRCWTTQIAPNVYNVYPVYDWKTADIWTYHAKFPCKRHNELYDRMHQAGLTIHQMRTCQPYGDDQRRGLWLFHIIEPATWSRVVARVAGANGGAEATQQSGAVSGYGTIHKPENLTWKQYADHLLSLIPSVTRTHYENKIFMFTSWWNKHGYPTIPDEADAKHEASRKVPSWRRVCKCLLRNDYWCKSLGFAQHSSKAYARYLEIMKRRRSN